ncbi:RES domain-containing protein, partial [Paraburkholderia sp. SIMBA_009]
MKLVDTVEEQSLLEDILEASKRPFPPECAGFDYLLATPFRYGAAYPHGSRFRRAGFTEGVYYA